MQHIAKRLALTAITVLGTACSDTTVAEWVAPTDAATIRATGGSALGSKLVFVSTRDVPVPDAPFVRMEIYTSNGDGTNPVRLTNNAYSEFFPTWSPNAREIVFDSNEMGPAPRNEKNLYIMNDDGSEKRLLTHGTAASWSPNGKQLAFHDVLPGVSPADSDVFVINADGTGRTNLTHNSGFDTDADWSPDGRKLLFTSTRGGGINIYVMNADGSDVTQLTFDAAGGENGGPDWSPNGKSIVYARRYPGHPRFEIYVMNADGSDQTRLTFNDALDATPSWSPDGKQMVFHSNRSSTRPQLYVMNADGTNQHPLPPTAGRNQWANWGQGDLGR